MTEVTEDHVLAVDLGTTGIKVGLVSLGGAVVWHADTTVTTEYLDGGGAEQDADAWWRIVSGYAREAMDSGVVPPEHVVAVSCTGQWASTVPVDARGTPVGPCIQWMDQRGGVHTRKAIGGPVAGYAPGAVVAWIRKTGGAPSPTGADPVGHLLHLQHDRPEITAAARWFLEPVDYLSMRFTGVASASHASMTAAWLTDNRHLDRLTYDPDLLRRCGVDSSRLPPLVPTGSIVGTVRPDVAADLGLRPETVVVTGTPDLHSAAIGAGTVRDFDTHVAISTTGWISCPVPFKKTDIARQIASVPGIRPGSYLVADNHETAGLCLQWLRDNVLGGDDFDTLTAEAAGSPPGSGSVLFTPWLAGERSPVEDHAARGGFHNLSLRTTRADLVRAVLEGVAYNSRWLHEAVERFAKRRLDPLRIFGGGAQSELWCQIHADVMDRTIERVVDPLHTGLRGAALFAGVALGRVDPDDLRDLVRVDRTFTPDPAARAVYDRLFAEFPRLYKAQKGMFARLNRHRSGQRSMRSGNRNG
jgi:xylulokinase